MPNTLWIETLFRRISPINNTNFTLLSRITFLIILWAIGAMIYAADGRFIPYISSIGIYEGLYLPGLIVLCGSYGVQSSLEKIIPRFQSLLDMNEKEFREYRKSVESVIYSFIPCLVIAFIFATFLSGVPTTLSQMTAEGVTIQGVWNVITALFFDLLSGTGVWMFLAIWYLILSVSRQNYQLDVLDRIGEGLGELMRLTLYYALFYFIAVSIAVALPFLSANPSSWSEVVFSPYLIFVALGALAVVFPLYSIHMAILGLKSKRIAAVRAESISLIERLEAAELNNIDSRQILAIMARLQATQIKGNHIQATPDWPVNMDFIGKIAGLIVMPTIVRIFIELFRGYLPI